MFPFQVCYVSDAGFAVFSRHDSHASAQRRVNFLLASGEVAFVEVYRPELWYVEKAQ